MRLSRLGTDSSLPPDYQGFRAASELGRSILAAGQPSSCRPTTDRGCKAAIQGAAPHRRIRRRDQGRAVGDESASRNRKFESTPLQRRVLRTFGSDVVLPSMPDPLHEFAGTLVMRCVDHLRRAALLNDPAGIHARANTAIGGAGAIPQCLARALSETAENARRVGSYRGGPGRYRLGRALVRAVVHLRGHPPALRQQSAKPPARQRAASSLCRSMRQTLEMAFCRYSGANGTSFLMRAWL